MAWLLLAPELGQVAVGDFLEGDVLAAAVRPVFDIGFLYFDAGPLHVYIEGIGGGGRKASALRARWESERGAEGGAVQRQLQAHGVCCLRPEDDGARGLPPGGDGGGQIFEGGRRARGFGFAGGGVEGSRRAHSREGVGRPVSGKHNTGTRLEAQGNAAHAVRKQEIYLRAAALGCLLRPEVVDDGQVFRALVGSGEGFREDAVAAGPGAVRALAGVISGELRRGCVLKVEGVVLARRAGHGAENTAVGLIPDIDIVRFPFRRRGGDADTVVGIPCRVRGAGGRHAACLAYRGGDNGSIRHVAAGFIVLFAASCGEHGCYHGRDSEKPG